MQEDWPAFAGQWHGANPEADARPLPGVAEAKAFMEERADVLRAVGFDAENQGYPLMWMGGGIYPPHHPRAGPAWRGGGAAPPVALLKYGEAAPKRRRFCRFRR